MLSHLMLVLAQQEGSSSKGGDPLGGFGMMPLLLVLFALFYFIVLRPLKRQENERKQMASVLEKNDKVLTTAGIYGTVVSVSEKEDEVVVKVDDNTRLRMLKSSILRNMTKEEQAKSKEQEKKGTAASTAITTKGPKD